MYIVRATEASEQCDSFAEAEAKANDMIFKLGDPDVVVTDDNGMIYEPMAVLQPTFRYA